MPIANFGRKYKVTVQLRTGQTLTVVNSDWEPEALRCEFDVFAPGYQNAFWEAEVSLWNLDQEVNGALLSRGDLVTVEAGYYNGQYGQIFQGKVFQPMWSRENNTDFVTTLRCLVGPDEITRNFVSFSYGPYTSQVDIVKKMADACFTKLPAPDIGNIQDNKDPRARGVFGSPREVLNQVARDNNAQWFVDGNGKVTIGRIDDSVVEEAIVYTPDSGIIDTPQQVQDGVIFSVQMDPRLKVQRPTLQVKLDKTVIRQAKQRVGVPQTILDHDGTYLVGAVRHFGDTRGAPWFTEVIGYTSVAGKLALLGAVPDGILR